jgi:SAM-dependent methyltransferase
MAELTASGTTGDPALAAYEQMATFYDAFTAADDYDRWVELLTGLIERYGNRPETLLDVATGTGKVAARFAQQDVRVTACDLSPAMIRQAAAKSALSGVQLAVADMRALPALDRFDVVTSIDDAVNYMLGENDLLAAFQSIASALRPGGLYLFDVNSLRAYRTTFAATFTHEHEGLFFAWEGRASPEFDTRDQAEVALDCFAREGGDLWRRTSCLHRQRHHDRTTVRLLLETAGLELLGAYGMHSDGVLDEADKTDECVHPKVIYVARMGA